MKANATETAVPVKEDDIAAILAVPPDFAGKPTFLTINFFDSYPPAGMPLAYGKRYEAPALVAGQDFPLATTQAGLQGSYYLSVVVYCEGGGNGRNPVAGVDWVGTATTPLPLGRGTGTVDAGRVDLVLE